MYDCTATCDCEKIYITRKFKIEDVFNENGKYIVIWLWLCKVLYKL